MGSAAGAQVSQDNSVLTRNIMGSPGIIDMPDARMAPDGELAVSGGFFKNTQHYNFDFQVLPWLETSFRYSGLQHFDPSFPVYYDRSFAVKARLWDETDIYPAVAIGVDDTVGTGIYGGEFVTASKKLGPLDFTLGMGWGRLGTANIITNPFRIFGSSFTRPRTLGTPGASTLSTLFHGPDTGIFGGVNWTTPLNGLTLSAEYSSDAYTLERMSGNFSPRNQVNLGASYEIFPGTLIGIDWLYGRSFGATLSFAMDPVRDPFPQRIGAEMPPVTVRSEEDQRRSLNDFSGREFAQLKSDIPTLVDKLWNASLPVENAFMRGRMLSVSISRGDLHQACETIAQLVSGSDLGADKIQVTRNDVQVRCPTPVPILLPAIQQVDERDRGSSHVMLAYPGTFASDLVDSRPTDRRQISARIRKDLTAQRLYVQAVSLTAHEAVVYYANYTYLHEAAAVERIVRVLMNDAPIEIEKFRIVATINGIPQREFDVLRGPLEREFSQTGELKILAAPNSTQLPPLYNPALVESAHSLYPHVGWSVFPQFRQQLFDPSNPFAVQFLAGGAVQLNLARGLDIQAEGELDIYDNFNTLRPADSALPHVRTDFVKFFSEGKNGIGDLEADYRFRLTPSVFAVARVGYLESMYAGAGGEVLWRPEGQRWALGVDGYEVEERDFNRLLGLQPYKIFTGHVSLYYASPWYDLNFAVRAGQYLAGDRGLTFEMTRRFASGVELGAFFTKTNVSAQQFGEGSFDKGIIIRIPLGWTVPVDTQSQFNMDLRPVQRDGGQRLLNDSLLYEETRRASFAEMYGQNAMN